jgi:photosystem II stability/assembly factor-like uncharacterized protein
LVQLTLSLTLIPCSAQTPSTVTVIAEQAPVQIGQKVIATVKKGEDLKVVEIKGDWYCVLPSRGWIHKQFLQVGIPSPEKDKPTVAAATTADGVKTVTWQQVPLRTAEQKAKGYLGGEMGQVAFTLAMCPADPNHLAIGIDTAAVYTSRDGGKSWQLRRRGIKSNGVRSVAFDPKNPRILWAAGFKSVGYESMGSLSDPLVDGIYRSTDGGDNWQLLRNAVFFGREAQNEYFAFDPKSFDGKEHLSVWVATHEEGLLKTTDAGQSWCSLGLTNMHINAVILHPKNDRRLLVAADTGLFRNDNAGKTFDKIDGGLPAAPVLGLAADPVDETVIYVALGEKGIWRSNDGGKSFRPRMNGIPSQDTTRNWVRLCISPANPKHLYADAQRAGGRQWPYWSHNGGMLWQTVEKREDGFLGGGCFFAEGFVAHPSNPNVAFHAEPVRKTTNGGRTWQYSSDGISGCRRGTRTSLAFRPDDPKKMVFFHIDYGCALTTDGGDTFTYCPPQRQADIGAQTTSIGAYDPTPGSRKLISAVGGWNDQRICISENDGKTWVVQPDTVGDYQFMAFHPQKANIVYAGRTKDSLRSRDGGKTWQTLPHPIKAMFLGNGDIVFASRKAGQYHLEVMRSSDQGETWTPLPSRILGPLYEIDVDPRNPDRLYAAAHTGVWVFDEKNWSKRDERHGLEKDNFGAMKFSKVAVDPTHPNIIYAGQNHCWRGTARGIFRSTDSGEHWENINGNLGPDLTVWAITVSPHDGTVWLGTDYGNWKLPPPK